VKIGITGAYGFIGSHLRRSTTQIGLCEVFDREKYSLFHIESMRPFVEGKDFIFHLAGANRAPDEHLMKVNTLGTFCLMEAIRRYAPQATILLASSLQVYGFAETAIRFQESHPVRPSNVYGLSKLFAEEIVLRYQNLYQTKGIILRMSNVYGAGCKPYYNSVVSTFIDLILKRQKIVVNGTGAQARDFIHVSDAVDAFLKSLQYDARPMDTFNVCTGIPVSINELINMIVEVAGIAIPLEYRPEAESVNFLIGDPSKASAQLQFRAKMDLLTGLKRTVRNWER